MYHCFKGLAVPVVFPDASWPYVIPIIFRKAVFHPEFELVVSSQKTFKEIVAVYLSVVAGNMIP
jgi:hypothetical protein